MTAMTRSASITPASISLASSLASDTLCSGTLRTSMGSGNGLLLRIRQPVTDRCAMLIEQGRRGVISPASAVESQGRSGQCDLAERGVPHVDQQALRPGLLPGVHLFKVAN